MVSSEVRRTGRHQRRATYITSQYSMERSVIVVEKELLSRKVKVSTKPIVYIQDDESSVDLMHVAYRDVTDEFNRERDESE